MAGEWGPMRRLVAFIFEALKILSEVTDTGCGADRYLGASGGVSVVVRMLTIFTFWQHGLAALTAIHLAPSFCETPQKGQ